jgi:hypothetical protein
LLVCCHLFAALVTDRPRPFCKTTA